MGIFKQLIMGMITGHQGSSKHGRYSNPSKEHHGRGYYNERPVNYSAMPAAPKACSSCQYPNSPQSKFCGQCGSSLNVGKCTGCGQSLTPGSKFCADCGQAI